MPLGARRLALGLGATALAVSACAPAASLQFDTVEPSTESRATIAAQPSGAKKIDPAQRIVVTASDGQLAEVSVMGPKGPVKGDLSADGTVWTAKRPTLAFGSTYTVEATAIDPRGVATNHTDEFRTLEPKDFFSGRVAPGEGAIVGVGMPITVTFDREIKNKDEVERALVVYTPTPLEGAWSWNGPDTVEFRPKDYWPGNIDVTVDLNLKGVQGSKGVYGQGNRSTTFSIGPSMITKVDAQTHQAKVFRDGEKIRTIPVTTGKTGFETRSGVKVIVSKERTRVMDAATGGTEESDPEYYRIEVEYAMRVTYTGEFVHAAPWSVGSQGYANVSHGCIGMSTSNAQWLYDQTNVGDVVEVTGTSNPQNLGNGITVWNETWDEWLAGSKNGTVTTVAAGSPIPDPGTVTIPDGTTTAGDSATATQTSFRR
ncbi:MAG: L,D-transpeptidase family protein [Actinomycetota bacterium]|nr:L,D-transpeptidase family protein [Actinomycetota bacterium]